MASVWTQVCQALEASKEWKLGRQHSLAERELDLQAGA